MSTEKLEREKRIKKERNRLRKIFKEISEEKKKITIPLIDRASFLLVSLEDYENDINEKGSTEFFAQGDQIPYERARPVVQQYNSANKLYQTLVKQLTDMLPDEEKDTALIKAINDMNKPL